MPDPVEVTQKSPTVRQGKTGRPVRFELTDWRGAARERLSCGRALETGSHL
jgi:hypothetical protein